MQQDCETYLRIEAVHHWQRENIAGSEDEEGVFLNRVEHDRAE